MISHSKPIGEDSYALSLGFDTVSSITNLAMLLAGASSSSSICKDCYIEPTSGFVRHLSECSSLLPLPGPGLLLMIVRVGLVWGVMLLFAFNNGCMRLSTDLVDPEVDRETSTLLVIFLSSTAEVSFKVVLLP